MTTNRSTYQDKAGSRILETQNLSTGYVSHGHTKVVSSELNLDIFKGELVSLLGPNGSGKSTLMRTIGGLQKALAGDVSINHINLSDLSSKKKATLLSFVLTDRIDSSNLKVSDIVSIGRYPYIGYMGRLSQKDKKIIEQSLDQCSLKGYELRLFHELSDGEKQRTMIARALTQDTPLMMLDEPTAHLDLPNRIEMMKMLRELAKETNKAILISTHELDLALQWSDTIWLMNRGGETRVGVPEDLILNGSFSDVFGNKTFYFDTLTGNFKLYRTSSVSVYLKGHGTHYEWTRRALEREGFSIITDLSDTTSSVKIDVSSNSYWEVSLGHESFSVNSISELLNVMRHLSKK